MSLHCQTIIIKGSSLHCVIKVVVAKIMGVAIIKKVAVKCCHGCILALSSRVSQNKKILNFTTQVT